MQSTLRCLSEYGGFAPIRRHLRERCNPTGAATHIGTFFLVDVVRKSSPTVFFTVNHRTVPLIRLLCDPTFRRMNFVFTWINFRVMVADMGRLHHKCNPLQALATCSITITNKKNHNVIDYDCIESNHNKNPDYICFVSCSERKQSPLTYMIWWSIFSDDNWYESTQQKNY